jgi:exodeoxyribonuclease VII large subunit
MEQLSFSLGPAEHPLSVSELTARIRDVLAREFDDIRVTGEISEWKIFASGHAYFTLKDDESKVRCVLFRSDLRYLRFKPSDGLAVLARGRLEVYESRGEYQFVVNMMQPRGLGALQLAFEHLKKKLDGEGLFAADRKRPLPRFPRRIGIITSPTGAVIRDMLNVIRRRSPGLQVRLFPSLVQGEGAAAGVCEGLAYFGNSRWPDVIIVGRGGGSLEDLWVFNEESVARAIAACPIPIVSAVGHETDFTIADFVADLRAPTPSAAAELVVPNRTDLLERVAAAAERSRRGAFYLLSMAGRRLTERGIERATRLLQQSLGRSLQSLDYSTQSLRAGASEMLATARRRVERLERRLAEQDLRLRFARGHRRLESADRLAAETIRGRLDKERRRLDPTGARLGALSPLRILERGYSIVETSAGGIVKRPSDAPVNTQIHVRLAEGSLVARVEET